MHNERQRSTLHSNGFFEFAFLLYAVHQVASVDKLHHQIKTVLTPSTNAILLNVGLYIMPVNNLQRHSTNLDTEKKHKCMYGLALW